MLPLIDRLGCGKSHHALELLDGEAALLTEHGDVLAGLLHIDDRKIHVFLLSSDRSSVRSDGRLEIIDGPHDVHHVNGIPNDTGDVLQGFVGHRSLV